MNFKPLKLSALAALAAGIMFSSCSPKYGAHFNNSSKFYEGEPQVTSVQTNETNEPVEAIMATEEVAPEIATSESDEVIVASTEKRTVIRQLAELPSIKKIVEEHKQNVAEIKDSNLDQKEIKKEVRKEEKRAHKEVKKQLVREIKDIKKAGETDQQNAMNRKIFIGIVVAAAGIIVAILASGPIGAVAIVVGVGLIAWGIIEQGGV